MLDGIAPYLGSHDECTCRGRSKSNNNLGLAYFEGHGVPKDIQKAEKWLEVSAAQGNEMTEMSCTMMTIFD